MAYGIEIHFGFTNPKDAFDFCDRSGFTVIDFNEVVSGPLSVEDFLDNPEAGPEFTNEVSVDIQKRCENVHEAILKSLGWTFEERDSRYYTVDSPYGVRQSSPMRLFFHYDPAEMGDEPKDLTLGFNLTSRYYPCILDMEDPHGAIYTVGFDQEMNRRLEICRAQIIAEFPQAHNGVVYIRQLHY